MTAPILQHAHAIRTNFIPFVVDKAQSAQAGGEAGEQPGADGGPQGSAGGDDKVVDADFEEVDDNKKNRA